MGLLRALVALAALLWLGACGVTGNFRFDPGYAPFASLGPGDADRELGLSLGPLPLLLARKVVREDDPELAALLEDVKAVRVYIYEVRGDGERVRTSIESMRASLIDAGWHPVIALRDDGERVSALVRQRRSDRISGLALMFQDGEEVVLVNVIGAIRPETIAFVMGELGVDMPAMTLRL